MKSYKIILALAVSALALASCTPKAHIKGNIKGAGNKELVVKQLNINTYSVLDTIKTSSDGSFAYDVKVEEGQPEFVYVFYGETRVAAFLLEKGENASVEADTLGNYTVSGSEGSEKLAEVEKSYTDFIKSVIDSKTNQEANKLLIDYYRKSLKYVMENPTSMTAIPVLFEKLYDDVPVFFNNNDALIFRKIADTLKTVYPESRYVKALDKEAAAREKNLQMMIQFSQAPELGYPDITLPDIKGQRISLSSVVDNNKVVLLHFWDSSDPAQSLMNNELLLPVYKEFHSRGLEIFAICLDVDKTQWGNVVHGQNLPWINVNDGRGGNSPAVTQFNIGLLPTTYIICDGDLRDTKDVKGIEGLRKELGRLLRQ